MVRENDVELLLTLDRHGIAHPNFIYSKSLASIYSRMEFGKKYMLKSMFGARSVGQKIVDKDMFMSMVMVIGTATYTEFNEKFNIDISTCRNATEERYLFDSLRDGDVYVSDLIEFDVEYRVLYFQGIDPIDYIIEDRAGYQANFPEKRSHTLINLPDTRMNINILKRLREFGDAHPSPMLSFDVYMTSTNEWGLFEYCTQFGIDYEGSYEKLTYQINYAISDAINDIHNRNSQS